MRKLIVVLLLAACLCIGCESQAENVIHTTPPSQYPSAELIWQDPTYKFNKVWFVHDDERRVGMWIYTAYERGGIAVLPDSEYQP